MKLYLVILFAFTIKPLYTMHYVINEVFHKINSIAVDKTQRQFTQYSAHTSDEKKLHVRKFDNNRYDAELQAANGAIKVLNGKIDQLELKMIYYFLANNFEKMIQLDIKEKKYTEGTEIIQGSVNIDPSKIPELIRNK